MGATDWSRLNWKGQKVKFFRFYFLLCRSEGTVVSIGIRNDGAEVAVKRMLKTYSRNIMNELKNLRLPQLENANVVQYKVK